MKHRLAFAIFALSTAAHAGEYDAHAGVAADAASTAAAFSAPGIGEVNPLGWATVPVRLAVVEHAKTLRREEGQPIIDAVSASSWGAAANNLMVLAGAGAAAPIIGVVVSYAVWKAGGTEREFWRVCAVYKQIDPPVQCAFKPWKTDELVRIAQANPRVH
jgi:hypothetical protein